MHWKTESSGLYPLKESIQRMWVSYSSELSAWDHIQNLGTGSEAKQVAVVSLLGESWDYFSKAMEEVGIYGVEYQWKKNCAERKL